MTTTRVDGIELIERAGAGGFSEVWKGRRVSDGTLVAVKFPRVPELTEHLRAEAEAVGGVENPSIVRPIHVRLDADPPHLVMPWIEGHDLELHDDTPPRAEILPALERVLELVRVVAFLHRGHIVHGDLKPGNIRIDTDGKTWLLDLGLARVQVRTRQERSLAVSLVSVTGESIAGTLEFMAPELLGGDPPTAASDVFSIGVILHHLLTGQPPSFGVGPLELNPFLPPSVEGLLAGMLHRDPEERPPSAAALVGPLERLLVEERACLTRTDGHERRRRAFKSRARVRRLFRALRHAVVPAVGLYALLRFFQPDQLAWLLGTGILGLLLLTLGTEQINLWFVSRLEERYQDRLERRRWRGRETGGA